MVLYEYPFNESIRTMLRLEHLFDRLNVLMHRDDAVDHHFALATVFEIMEVASRADLKSDVLKELDRHRTQLQAYRGNPNVSERVLTEIIDRIDHAFNGLNQQTGKAGHSLTGNEWLMSIRSRINIPGGTCEFDLPAYYAWQQLAPSRRRTDLARWAECLWPLASALQVLLRVVRDSGMPFKAMAQGGNFQQSLPQGKSYHLLRLRLDPALELVPEISGHRLIVSIRLMKADTEGRLRPCGTDTAFELALCA